MMTSSGDKLSFRETVALLTIPRSEIGKAWAWKSGQHVEFHGPGDFCWHGRGCCLSGTPGLRAGALGAVEKAVTAAGGASLPQS